MIRFFILACVIGFWGCSQSNQYPIGNGDSEAGFYIRQLNNVNKKLQTGKDDTELLYKKLFASQQLSWPEDVSKEIQTLMSREGLDYELYRYATDFYQNYRQYEALNAVVDRWLSGRTAAIQDFKWKIVALNGLQRDLEAKEFLWSLLQQSDRRDDLLFAAHEYLRLQDTTRAIYAFSRVAQNHPHEPALLESYIPILLSQGYAQKAKDLLVQQKAFIEGFEAESVLAKTLYELGEVDEALGLMRNYDNPEALYQLADWYHRLNRWDSAVYYADRLILLDSSRKAVFKKASIMEDRGWLNSALENFSVLISADPSDSIAVSRAQIVERKIAYLRRLREAEQNTPVLDISPKKSTENE